MTGSHIPRRRASPPAPSSATPGSRDQRNSKKETARITYTITRSADTPGVRREGALGALEDLGRLVRTGAGVVMEAAADDRTGQMIDRVAGPQWRWVARAASVAAEAARGAIRAREEQNEPNGTKTPPPRVAERLKGDGRTDA